MRAVAFISLLSVALSASAITVTEPSASSGWSSTGSNTLSWDRVDTDPTNFTVVLTNTDRTVLPTNDQVLVSFVDATSGSSIVIDAPSGGYNVGGTYIVNLVKSETDLNTIYAQSSQFNITSGTGSASGSSTAAVSSTGSITSVKSTTATGTAGGTQASSSGTATSELNPSSSASNAASPRHAEYGLLGAMLLFGGFLA